MSDVDNSSSPGLTGTIYAWAVQAYQFASWAVDFSGSNDNTPPQPTAMQQFRAGLDPRPGDTLAPNGADNGEIAAIDMGFQAVLDFADGNAASEDTTGAETLLAQVRQLVVTTTAAVATRALDTAKTDLSDQLKAIAQPVGVLPAEARALAKTRTTLARAISAVAALDRVGDVRTAITQFGTQVTAALEMVKPRADAAAQIAAAKSERKALSRSVDRGFLEVVTGAITTAEEALAQAKTKTDITGLRAALKLVMDKAPDAVAYGKDFDAWALRVEMFLAVYAPDPDKSNRSDPKKLRDQIEATAAAKTRTFDFAGARTELAKFSADASVTSIGGFTDLGSFADKLRTHQAAYDAKRQEINASKMKGYAALNREFNAACKKGIKTKQWSDAETLLDALATKIDKLLPIARHWVQVHPLIGGLAATDPFVVAIDTVKTKIDGDGNGDYTAALKAFTDLSGDDTRRAALLQQHKALVARADTLNGQGFAAQHTLVSPILSGALADIPGDLDGANTKLGDADTKITAMEGWAAEMIKARVAKDGADSGDAFKYLKPATDAAAQHKYGDAKTAATQALAAYAALSTFLETEALAKEMLTGLTSGTAPHTALDTAIKAANTLARTDAKPADATAALQTALADPALAQLRHETAQWLALIGAVQKRHDKITASMAPPAAKKTMTDLFTAAKAKAETDHKYVEAVALLEAYDAKLPEARAYSTARARVRSVKSALDKAVAKFTGTVANVQQAVYGHTDDSRMTAAISAAETLATQGKVAEARAAYEKLLTDWNANLLATATLHEQADGAGSNAGHSLDRHGADVTDEKLLARLITGIAADSKTSATRASSKFETAAAWLEGREESGKMVEAKEYLPGKRVDLGATSITADGAADLSFKVIVEHEGPIDKAFVGLKQMPSMDMEKGRVRAGSICETYDELTGITRSQALWIYEIDWSGITLPPPHKPSGYKQRETAQCYIDAYCHQENPARAAPANIPGRWVMMQLFPLVAGWNQETQDYD